MRHHGNLMVEVNIHVQVPLAAGEPGGYQRIRKGRGPGNVNPLAVKKCAGPAISSPCDSSAMVTLKHGNPCAKFVVPSRGSTYQRKPDALSCPPPSSATMACDGNCAVNRSMINRSDARSASVTRSYSPLDS